MSTYDEMVEDAAESMVAFWEAQDAGDSGTEERKWAAWKVSSIVDGWGVDEREVWRDVRRRAMEEYAGGRG